MKCQRIISFVLNVFFPLIRILSIAWNRACLLTMSWLLHKTSHVLLKCEDLLNITIYSLLIMWSGMWKWALIDFSFGHPEEHYLRIPTHHVIERMEMSVNRLFLQPPWGALLENPYPSLDTRAQSWPEFPYRGQGSVGPKGSRHDSDLLRER